MRKFTLLIASLFITIGAMAQDLVVAIDNVGKAPYKLSDEDAAKIFELENLTVVLDVTTASTFANARGAFFCVADPAQPVPTEFSGTNTSYMACGYNAGAIAYIAAALNGQHFSSGSIPTNQTIRIAYVLDKTNNLFKSYIGDTNTNWTMNRNFNTYEIATPKMVKEDFENANIYIGGGIAANTARETANATINAVYIYDGALTIDQIKAKPHVDWAKSIKGKVGYPVDSEIDAFISEVQNKTLVSEIETARTELVESTNINMPIDGKAYTFKNIHKDGTTYYFKYSESGITLSLSAEDAEVFICRKKDDKYVFVNNAGKFLTHKGNNSSYIGPNSNKGYTDAYDQTASKFLNDFGVNKLTTTNVATTLNNDGLTLTNRHLFGSVGIYTARHDKDENVYYVMKTDNSDSGFDQANAPFVRHNLSSMIKMEEVEYPNMLNMNLIVGDLVNVEGTIATFSAPFATVVPEGVKAYYAAENGGEYISLKEVEGAIPANEGVIVIGGEEIAGLGTVVMKPATSETVAAIENNLLGHSAGAAKDLSGVENAYILALQPDGIGFYACSGGTLAMNKSYLQLEGASNAVAIRLPGTTGVDEIADNRVQSTEIYDLTGRRVEEITAPGIYIVGGKKVLAK